DPSAIIYEALYRLEHDRPRLDYFRKRFTTIIVDEFQESDSSQRKLLALLAPQDLLIFADPDSAVGRFRGADPDGLVRALAEFSEKTIVFDFNFRSVKQIRELVSSIANGFRSYNPAHKRGVVQGINEGPAIAFAKLSSQSESAHYIAYSLRRAHLHEGLPWSRMAVIVRSPGFEVSALQRAFAQNGIPVSIDSAALALADNPAIKPLLLLSGVALKEERLTITDWPVLEEILLSEFGGADALALRRIRLAFSAVRTDHRTTTEMMIDALTESAAELPWEQIAPLKRVNDLIKVGRSALGNSKDISDLLWALWESAVNYEGSKIAYLWRERALAG